MTQHIREGFTKYEIARIIGARALQIAMDAPLLLKISEEKLKEIRFDALKIAELEFDEGALPISIERPMPRKKRDKLTEIREDKVTDEELVEKEKEVEKEIAEEATELGFTEQDEEADDTATAATATEEEQ